MTACEWTYLGRFCIRPHSAVIYISGLTYAFIFQLIQFHDAIAIAIAIRAPCPNSLTSHMQDYFTLVSWSESSCHSSWCPMFSYRPKVFYV